MRKVKIRLNTKIILEKYKKGTIVSGKVIGIEDICFYIEIENGVIGLINISEMSWTEHVKHPSQVVSIGQIILATILGFDKIEKKLVLGMKQLEQDPWDDIMAKYPVNSHQKGFIRNLTKIGMFVELEPGIDGLVHISDISWTKKIRYPGEFFKKDEEIEVCILSIDYDKRRIALGYKQLKNNPWDNFEQKYQLNYETEAKIVRINKNGIIVELPDGVDGFVSISHLTFSPVKDINEFFNIGDLIPLKVIDFDKEAKKIILSVVELLRDK